MKRGATGLLVAALVTGIAPAALAQGATPTIPTETLKSKTVTKGTTDVAKGGFAAGGLPAEDDPREASSAAISAGGLFSSGNARTVAVTTAAKFKIRRQEHQFSTALAVNFARGGKAGESVDTTAENYQGLVRYDYFFTDRIAGFFQTSGRRDRFQGLDLRSNFDPGVAYYFINTKKHSLRGEGGYDLQYDVRRDASRVQEPAAVAPGAPPAAPLPLLDKTQTLHNIRLFAGYENKLYKEVGLVTGLEYLQNVSDLGTYRLIFDIGIKSNIADNLAIATTYTMRFENKPLPTVVNTDSIASVNLVYTLF